jgi:hypothetical protein
LHLPLSSQTRPSWTIPVVFKNRPFGQI